MNNTLLAQTELETYPSLHFPTLSPALNPQTLSAPFPPAPQIPFALRRDLGYWQLTFAGRHATLKHEQGLAYVAYLLLNPPKEPIHGMALALKVRALSGKPTELSETLQQRAL